MARCLVAIARTTVNCQTSNIRCSLVHAVGNKFVAHSDGIGASPVSAAPTTSSFSTWHMASMDWANTTATCARPDETHLSLGFGATYIINLTVNTTMAAFVRNDPGQVTATHLKIRYIYRLTINDLQWLHLKTGQQDSSSRSGHQGNVHHWQSVRYFTYAQY